MDDLDITKEFNKFSTSINLLATVSSELKRQIDEIVSDLSNKLVEIKKEELDRVNTEILELSTKISEKKELLEEFIKTTVDAITKYNETIKNQIGEIKVISQDISNDASSKFTKALATFDDKMKNLDEQIRNVYNAGLKSDFDTLSRSFIDLEKNYESLSSTVQGSFIKPITEIKSDLKSIEIKIDNSFNNTNNNIDHRFDNALNKMELILKDQAITTEKVNNLIQKSEVILQKADSNNKKLTITIILSLLAFIIAFVSIIIVFIK